MEEGREGGLEGRCWRVGREGERVRGEGREGGREVRGRPHEPGQTRSIHNRTYLCFRSH